MEELVKRAFIEFAMQDLAIKLAKHNIKAANIEAAAPKGKAAIPAKPNFNWSKFRGIASKGIKKLAMGMDIPAHMQVGPVPPPAKPGFNWGKFRQGALGDLGPAAGSVVGAGVANAYGINPIAGAAAGYGLGAIPEIIHGIRMRGIPH